MRLIDLVNPVLHIQKEKNQIKLSEDAENSSLRNIILTGISESEHISAFNLDKKVPVSVSETRKLYNEFLNNQLTLINRRCDGVIIYQKDNELQILICEMKSAILDPQDYEYQLQNVGVFINYLIELYLKVAKQSIEIKAFKYVLFYRKKPNPLEKQGIVYIPKVNYIAQNMINFDEDILKYPCKTKDYNFIKLSELIEK